MAVRAQTAAEIRSGRVGPRGRRLRENLTVDAEATEHLVLPSVFALEDVSRVRGRSRVTTSVGPDTSAVVAREAATTFRRAV